MHAIVVRSYGLADIHDEEVAEPTAPDDGVVIAVRAVALNPLDAHFLRGTPYVGRPFLGLLRPRRTRPGVDLAGRVLAIGRRVERFAPGDAVFGNARGALAERVSASESALTAKPPNVSFEAAAALPIAGCTALQGLRDKAAVSPGQKVLIHGAAGGIGTYAVQIGKWLGAEVTGVCSTRNVALVRALGADHVIDYTREDFTAGAARYDVVFDCIGDRPLSACRRVLAPGGLGVMVGGRMGRYVGPFGRLLRLLVVARFARRQRLTNFLARSNSQDLGILGALLAAGTIRSVIDGPYRWSEAGDALRHLDAGHARGKVVITVDPERAPIP